MYSRRGPMGIQVGTSGPPSIIAQCQSPTKHGPAPASAPVNNFTQQTPPHRPTPRRWPTHALPPQDRSSGLRRGSDVHPSLKRTVSSPNQASSLVPLTPTTTYNQRERRLPPLAPTAEDLTYIARSDMHTPARLQLWRARAPAPSSSAPHSSSASNLIP